MNCLTDTVVIPVCVLNDIARQANKLGRDGHYVFGVQWYPPTSGSGDPRGGLIFDSKPISSFTGSTMPRQ